MTWTILFDLDDTLVITHPIEYIREKAIRNRNWGPVYSAFIHTSLPPLTKEMISSLKEYKLGVVTSSQRIYAINLLQYHGLNIPVLSAFHDTFHRKPSPDPILRAMEKLGSLPSKTIYVGDTEEDVASAFAAKCTPFLIDRSINQKYFGTPYVKDLRRWGGCLISDWDELADALEETKNNQKSIFQKQGFFSKYGNLNLGKRKDMEQQGYDIFFHYTYYPPDDRFGIVKRDYEISELLYCRQPGPCLKIKSRRTSKVVEFFADKLEEWINPEASLTITVAPSRKTGFDVSGEALVARRVAERNPNFVDGTNCIIRTESVEPNEDDHTHLRTISTVIEKNLRGKNVIVLDNITTKGSTLQACIEKVRKAGANQVIGLAIAITRGKDGR